MDNKNLKLLSLFSGCGGMDLGFEGGFPVLRKSLNPVFASGKAAVDGDWATLPRNGFETVFANDIRPGAKVAWENYFQRPGVFHVASVVDLVKAAKRGEWSFPEADVVTGGFPCQDFSLAGKRAGFESAVGHHGGKLGEGDEPAEENRGKLYMWMREVIGLVRPRIFVAENVKGLASLGDVKQIIEEDFRNVGGGYVVVTAKTLAAPEFGVPQTRERVIFFGFRKDALRPEAAAALQRDVVPAQYDPYPQPTHRSAKLKVRSAKGLPPPPSCGDAFVGLLEPEDSSDPSQRAYSKAAWYGKHCQGNRELDLTVPAPTIRSEHHGNIEFRRLAAEHGGVHDEELARGSRERRLTVRECARAQTFPDNYEFVRRGALSTSEAYKLIGNAVPPLLAYHIARRLRAIIPALFGT